jgi:ribosome-associated protein
MTNDTQSESAAKKDTQKLQRAIVDGLEDVKAQDVVVFNTEHLSPLFERVIVASGTSNRQTKALAASVRDAVREAGFPKPRIEGEDNGEWIIVDCGAAVAHIMQPAIRQYYHLEEIWGDKPVRLKFGSSRPAQAEEEKPAKEQSKNSKKKAADDGPSLRRSSAAKTAVKAAEQVAREEKAASGGRKPSARGIASRNANAVRAGGTAPAKAPSRAPARAASGTPARAPSRAAAGTSARAPAGTPARAPARAAGTAARAPAKAPARAPAQKTPGKMLVVNAPGKKPAAKKVATAKAPVRKPASRRA